MRLIVFFCVFCIVCIVGCKNQKVTKSYERNGVVFRALNLPAPNAIRAGSGAPGKAYWQQRSDHDIRVELDTDNEIINGSETIVYTNNSPDELSYIWFHLEQNALRDDSIRSRGGRESREDSFAGITISKLTLDSLPAVIHQHGTVGRIDLSAPLPSGANITIELDWSFPFPMVGGMRMGYDDSPEHGAIWELAQWIPVPCVYDDVNGWNTLPYIGSGEFYTNFGNYDVAITVPRNQLVFGSGTLTNPEEVLTDVQQERLKEAMESEEVIIIRSEEEVVDASSRPAGEGPLTWKFHGNDIRTFAWGSSASYLWDACSVKVVNEDGSTHRVLCQAAYPAEAHDVWEDAATYVKHSIAYYSERIYPFPWPQMTVISGRAGGMEYPMIVYCRSGSKKGLFSVTDHEIGHSWFPMLINTDERRHAWMDEGFNTFFDHYSKLDYYQNDPEKYSLRQYNASRYTNTHTPINTPADQLKSRRHLSYYKPAYGLRLLREEIMGEERFDFAFNEYVQRWAFKSPRPADFYRTMEDASGMDLQWFFRGFFEEALQLDQSIADVKQREKNESWSVRVTLDNLSDWVCPVDLEITCIDGSTHSFVLPESIWYWSSRHSQRFDVPSKVVNVTIDPRNVYPDFDRTNNSFIVWQ